MKIAVFVMAIMVMCICPGTTSEEKNLVLGEQRGARDCRSPKGKPGSVRYDVCIQSTCTNGKWKPKLRTDICCYKQQAHKPNTVLDTIVSSDNCSTTTIGCGAVGQLTFNQECCVKGNCELDTTCKSTWSFPKNACIPGKNMIITPAPTMKDCVKLCQEEKSYECISVDYEVSTGRCHLSTFNSKTAASDITIPCYLSGYLYSDCIKGNCELDTTCKSTWFFPKNACIPGKNMIITPAPTMKDCVKLCQEEKSYECLSVDYEVSTGRCHLSTFNSKTAAITIPCYLAGYLYTECLEGNCKLGG